MKDERNLRQSGRAQFFAARKAMKKVAAVLEQDPENVDDGEMADLRDYAADLVRHVHEFNAYRNALEWNDRERGRF